MILLAPMEGVIDPILRNLLTSIGGYDYCATEFVRVTSQLNPAKVFYKYAPELKNQGVTDSGTPVFIQILGGQTQPMAENAAFAAELGAKGVDINFGCPAKTVNRHDGGSVILQWPERVFKITEAVRKAMPDHVPLTVKIRLGYLNSELALDNALAAEAGGAKWLSVHARTKVDGYKPPAHWNLLAPIKEKLKIPLIANGDVWKVEDAKKCLETTGCEHLMLGRGAVADPFLALGIQDKKINKAWKDVLPFVIQLLKFSDEFKGASFATARCKQWLKLLGRNYPEALSLFENVKREKTTESIMSFLSGCGSPKQDLEPL